MRPILFMLSLGMSRLFMSGLLKGALDVVAFIKAAVDDAIADHATGRTLSWIGGAVQLLETKHHHASA